MPISAIMPTVATKDSVSPIAYNIHKAPITPSGITESTIKVLLKVRNSSTRIAKSPKIAIRTMVPIPPKDSARVSNSPPAAMLKPSGFSHCCTFSSTCCANSLVLYPVATKAVTEAKRSLLKCRSMGWALRSSSLATCSMGTRAPLIDVMYIREKTSRASSLFLSSDTRMRYSSPLPVRSCPISSPAKPRRTVRAISASGTPNMPAFSLCTTISRSVLTVERGLLT